MKQPVGILLFVPLLALSSYAQDAHPNNLPQPPSVNNAPAEHAGTQDKPRIFVTDEPIHERNFVAHGRAAAAHSESGPNARVVEIQSDLVKVCPKVTVTNRLDMADFTLLFRREGGKRSAMFAFGGLAGLALSAASKVDGASLFSADGDLVTATKQRTVEKSIIEICAAIPATFLHAALPPEPVQVPVPTADTIPAPIVPPPPAAAQATTELALGSTPTGAEVEVDGAFVGNTPSIVAVTSGDHTVRVSKKGFKPYEKTLRTSSGKINLNAELEAVAQ